MRLLLGTNEEECRLVNVWILKHQTKCNLPIGSRVKFGTGTLTGLMVGDVVDHLFSWSSITPHTCNILTGVLLDSGMTHYVYANWLERIE